MAGSNRSIDRLRELEDELARDPRCTGHNHFSGVGDGSTDDSAALQSAIDACAAQANGGQVYAPPAGVAYVVDNITLKARVDIIGVGQRPVAFKAKSGSSNPMWRLDTGPVNNCRYENFVCLGSTENPRQNCFELRATPSSKAPYNGGLWWAIFSNISVSGFSGFGMWFRGGVTGIVNAHQFIELRRVTIFRANDTYSRALLLTGQCGQFSIDGECQLDGIAKGTGTNVEIGPEYNNAGVAGGQLVGGSPVGGNAPYNIKFIGCTSQSAETAFYVYNSINILHHGCYFENTQRAIRHVGGTSGSIIENCHFTNAASDGVGGGYCIQGAPLAEAPPSTTIAQERPINSSTERPPIQGGTFTAISCCRHLRWLPLRTTLS